MIAVLSLALTSAVALAKPGASGGAGSSPSSSGGASGPPPSSASLGMAPIATPDRAPDQTIVSIPLPAGPSTTGGSITAGTSVAMGSYSVTVQGTVVPLRVRTTRTARSDGSADFQVTLGSVSGSAGVLGPSAPVQPGDLPSSSASLAGYRNFGFELVPMRVAVEGGRARLIIAIVPVRVGHVDSDGAPGADTISHSASADGEAGDSHVTGRLRTSVSLDSSRICDPALGCMTPSTRASASGEVTLSMHLSRQATLELGVALSRSILTDSGMGSSTITGRVGTAIETDTGERVHLDVSASTSHYDGGAGGGIMSTPDPAVIQLQAGGTF